MIAKIQHRGQLDKGGHPYIDHCTAVAAQMDEPKLKAAALIHDVFEDTDLTPIEALSMGVDPDIVHIASIVTRQKGETYREYIRRVGEHSGARRIKLADLRENMKLDRLPVVTSRDKERVEKRYKPAYDYLMQKECAEEPDIV